MESEVGEEKESEIYIDKYNVNVNNVFKNILNNVKRLSNVSGFPGKSCGHIPDHLPHPANSHKPPEIQNLAGSIAEELNDTDNLAMYKKYCKIYPRHIIQNALEQALAIPDDKVKKSRGALFTYLVKYMMKNDK
jgi:hypothetical protein